MRVFDSDEIMDLTNLTEETNNLIELKVGENELRAAHGKLKKNLIFYMTSGVQFHTLQSPRSCYINLRVDYFNDNIVETLEKLVRCVAPPYRIFIDFFCVSESSTQPDPLLIHPSVSTHYNETTLIIKLPDRKNLLAELSQANFNERILEKHHLARRCNRINF